MSNVSREQAIDRLAVPRRLLELYLTEAGLAASRKLELGRRIREARQEKRWKQKHLAAAVHVEPVTVSRWERGQHEPDIDMLEQIALATGKPLSFFLDVVVTPDQPAAAVEILSKLDEVLGRLDRLEQQAELRERRSG